MTFYIPFILLLVSSCWSATLPEDAVHALQARKASRPQTIYVTSTITRSKIVSLRPTTVYQTVQQTYTEPVLVYTTSTVTIPPQVKNLRVTQVDDFRAKATLKKGKQKDVLPTVTKTRYQTKTQTITIQSTITSLRTHVVKVDQTSTETIIVTQSQKPSRTTSSSSQSAPTGSANPPAPSSTELTNKNAFRDHMVQLHNTFRADFGNPPLVWNSTLANFAQSWTDKCGYYHSVSLNNPIIWFAENIAAAWADSAQYLSAYDASLPAQLWMQDEFALYSYSPRTSRNDEATGHFQNAVWKSYTDLGCAVSYCPNGLTDEDGHSVTNDPALFWSCDFWLQPTSSTDWSVGYNIPRNITVVADVY